jgi:hypothetical protein
VSTDAGACCRSNERVIADRRHRDLRHLRQHVWTARCFNNGLEQSIGAHGLPRVERGWQSYIQAAANATVGFPLPGGPRSQLACDARGSASQYAWAGRQRAQGRRLVGTCQPTWSAASCARELDVQAAVLGLQYKWVELACRPTHLGGRHAWTWRRHRTHCPARSAMQVQDRRRRQFVRRRFLGASGHGVATPARQRTTPRQERASACVAFIAPSRESARRTAAAHGSERAFRCSQGRTPERCLDIRAGMWPRERAATTPRRLATARRYGVTRYSSST